MSKTQFSNFDPKLRKFPYLKSKFNSNEKGLYGNLDKGTDYWPHILTFISFKPDVKDLWYFKLKVILGLSRSNNQSLKYQRFTPAGKKDKGVRTSSISWGNI